MIETRTARRDRVIACLAVLVAHVAMGWALLRLDPHSPAADAEDQETITVEFIARPRAAPSPTQAPSPTTRARHRRHTSQQPTTTSRDLADRVEPTQPAGSRPLSAVMLGQVRQCAEENDTQHEPPDPFADRQARLPAADNGRFRMREPTSIASVVEKIGDLFYPPGEGRNPCPDNRERIAGLLTQGDSRELQDAGEFERRYCRP